MALRLDLWDRLRRHARLRIYDRPYVLVKLRHAEDGHAFVDAARLLRWGDGVVRHRHTARTRRVPALRQRLDFLLVRVAVSDVSRLRDGEKAVVVSRSAAPHQARARMDHRPPEGCLQAGGLSGTGE